MLYNVIKYIRQGHKVAIFMDKYILFLDESETFKEINNHYFAVGGIIVEETISTSVLQADIDALKRSLWVGHPNPEALILHEKEISEAHRNGSAKNPVYNIFKQNSCYKTLYAGLSKIIENRNITTIGVCLNESTLKLLYPGEVNSKLTIALQMLLENYCHFLMHNNAEGDICYESLQDPGNQELRQRFYELEALGTMYYTPHFFQTHIGDIRFTCKTKNLAGLQLADFIPNTLARKIAGLEAKHNDFKKAVFSHAYDGGISNARKYGLKEIP